MQMAPPARRLLTPNGEATAAADAPTTLPGRKAEGTDLARKLRKLFPTLELERALRLAADENELASFAEEIHRSPAAAGSQGTVKDDPMEPTEEQNEALDKHRAEMQVILERYQQGQPLEFSGATVDAIRHFVSEEARPRKIAKKDGA